MNELSYALTDLATESEICSGMMVDDEINHVGTSTFTTMQVKLSDDLGSKDDITPEYISEIHYKYKIKESGLYSIIIEVCNDVIGEALIDGTVSMKGNIEFINPYGYLSGIYYGYLPFEGLRGCIFTMFLLIYFILFYKHYHTLLISNWCILIVVFLCTFESLMWFSAYLDMNESGQPYCCPFPILIAISMFLQVIRRTISRALLLSICLGLGLAKESLNKNEKCFLFILSLLYLISSLLVKSHDIIETNNLHHDSSDSFLWELPQLILDMIFLVWIYVALLETMTNLKNSGQT